MSVKYRTTGGGSTQGVRPVEFYPRGRRTFRTGTIFALNGQRVLAGISPLNLLICR